MLSYKRALDKSSLSKAGNHNIIDFIPANDSHFFVSSGRGGLEACIDLLGITKNDSVLMPAFVAEGVISPFQKKNVRVVRYKSKPDLKLDAEDIKKKINQDKSVKCILVIHYFGFPQNIN